MGLAACTGFGTLKVQGVTNQDPGRYQCVLFYITLGLGFRVWVNLDEVKEEEVKGGSCNFVWLSEPQPTKHVYLEDPAQLENRQRRTTGNCQDSQRLSVHHDTSTTTRSHS